MSDERPQQDWRRQVWDPDAHPYPSRLQDALAVIDADFVQPEQERLLGARLRARCHSLLSKSWWRGFDAPVRPVAADEADRLTLLTGLRSVADQVVLIREGLRLEVEGIVQRQAVQICTNDEQAADSSSTALSWRGVTWAFSLEARLQTGPPPDHEEIARWERVLHASLLVREILKEASRVTSDSRAHQDVP